jgi:predicted PurR-regulated permease PerM
VATFGVLGVLVAAPLVAIVGIVHTELYRKYYMPRVTDADLDRLARITLHEKLSDDE